MSQEIRKKRILCSLNQPKKKNSELYHDAYMYFEDRMKVKSKNADHNLTLLLGSWSTIFKPDRMRVCLSCMRLAELLTR